MIGAAKRKSSLLPGLAALRLVLLLIVTLCLGETRVWGFAITPQPTSGVFESATPSCIGQNTTAIGYDASDSLHAARAGALDGANFAQKTFSQTCSSGGRFAGQTIDDVAGALRSGAMKPADVPIEYIVRAGSTLILNTRSAQALQQAGIPRSAWNAIDMTGDAAAQARLSGQLQRNGLTSQGIPNPTGR